MNNNNNNLFGYFIIGVIAVIIIHYIFNSNKTESLEIDNLKFNKLKTCLKNRNIKTLKCVKDKPEKNTLDYLIDDLLYEKEKECSKPPQPIKEFHKDFFNFRDSTNQDSRWTEDPVDRINDLYLSGNLGKMLGHTDIQIKDLYDCATKNINLDTKQHIKLDGPVDNTLFSLEKWKI